VVLGLVVGPDPAHGVDPIGEQRHPGAWIGAVVGQLLTVPSGADAEQEAAVGDPFQARHRLCRDDRTRSVTRHTAVPSFRVVVTAATADRATNGS
jgi:hypothetical protein